MSGTEKSKTIFPMHFPISGKIRIPASKSHTQRVLACALMNPEETRISGLGKSDDEQVALKLIEQLGATITTYENEISVRGADLASHRISQVEMGEAGLSTRMFTPILAVSSNSIEIRGKGSILKRPMTFFESYFPQLGIQIKSTNGCLPLEIQGPLSPISLEVDASQSSQYITGLIYAFIASKSTRNETITLKNPASIPYLNLSLEVLKSFGIFVEFQNFVLHFSGPYSWKKSVIQIEGDWSSASFFCVAAAISGTLTIQNLNPTSVQADRAILEVIKQFGARISWKNNDLTIASNHRNGFEFDATHCPDLFPPLAVLAVFGNKKSTIKGIHRLIHKESNRALAIQSEFQKMGIHVVIEADEMHIFPTKNINKTTIDTHGDHRIAMACAILGIFSTQGIELDNPNVVNKSFPEFYSILEELSQK